MSRRRDREESLEAIKKLSGRGGLSGGQRVQQNPYMARPQNMANLAGMSGMDVVGSGGAGALPGLPGMGQIGARDLPIANTNFNSPWLKDAVKLSLEAQINMIEQRNISGLAPAPPVLNRLKVLCLKTGKDSQANEEGIPLFGLFLAIEPPGNYITQYHSRKRV